MSDTSETITFSVTVVTGAVAAVLCVSSCKSCYVEDQKLDVERKKIEAQDAAARYEKGILQSGEHFDERVIQALQKKEAK